MGLIKILKAVVVVFFAGLGLSVSFSVSAQEKGFALDGSHVQVHASKEDYGKENLSGVNKHNLEFWYIVKDLNAKDWNVILTYPRSKEGEVELTTDEIPEIAAYYPWGGWAGIIHNDQLFYLSKFVPTFSERYGDYGDYDLFHSALSVMTSTYLTRDGVIHRATVDKIGDYAMAETDIHVIDVILYSDDNGGEDPDLEFGDYVFYNCTNFIGIPEGSPYKVIPNNVTRIGKGIFKGCSAMTRMIIGDKVEVIPEETFDGCTALKELKLGSGVKEIRCSITGLKRLVVSAPVPPTIAPGCSVEAEEIWVPEKLLSTYKAAWQDKNIKPYSFKFLNNPVTAYAGYQADVKFERVSPGEGENNYVYCYPREKDSNGNQNFLWTVDATHGSNTESKKFKTVWYSYDCDKRGDLAAGNVVYENLTRVRFDKPGTYKLYFTTLDITNHTEEVTVEVGTLAAGYVPVEKITVSDAGALVDHTLRVNATEKLRATIGTQGGATATFDNVTWESSNPEVATVTSVSDKIADVTGVAPGEAVITARSTDPIMPDVYGTYNIKVVQRMESCILEADYGGVWDEIENPGIYTLQGIVGETLRIRPVCFPEGTSYTALYIKDDNTYPGTHPEIDINVDEGTIFLKSAGTTQLNVGVRDGEVYREKTVRLVVSEPGGKVTDIRVVNVGTNTTYDYSTGYTGDVTDQVPIRLSYNGDAEHKQVVWESDNKQIAEVVPTSQIATLADDNLPQHHFTILCKKSGTARLTAVAADGGTGVASFPVTINQPEVVSVPAKQIVLEDKQVLYTTNFWFELHKDGTAALVHPSAGTDNPLTENGIPSTPYNFDYPGEEYITTYRRMLWSPLMDSLQYANRDLYFTALKVPGEITVSGKKYEVTAVGDYAFAGSNVKCIHIPRTVKSIGDYAFKDAKNYVGFTDVTHYEVIHDGVESLGKGIFSGCSKLRNMRFGHGIVEIPEETFDGCTSLKTIHVGRNVEKINCSFNQPNLNSIAFSGHVPPVFAEGCSVQTINNNISTNVSSVDEYKAAFPEFNVSAPSVEITSVSRSKAYVGDEVMFKYNRISNGVCEFMEFYPAGVNAEGMAYGAFTHSGTTSSNDWLILKFDDLSAIYDATSISSASATFYITFAKTGLHKVYINPMQNPDLDPVVVEVVVVPGTPVKDIVINDPPLYMDIDEVRRINVKVLPENASDKSIRWVVTGDDGIVEINEKNEIKAKAIGSVVVRAVSTDTVGPTRVSPQFTVRVIQSVKEVVVKTGETVVPNTGIKGYVGDKINLNASFLPENCEYNTCSWSATPDAILKVEGEDKNAVLQLTGAGRGVLSVNVSQLTGLTALRRDIPVLALMPVNSIRVTKDGAEINPGEPIVGDIGSEYLLTATPNADADKKDLEWSISNPDIIDLISDGDKVRIVLKAIGTAYLRIKATDERNYEIVIPIGVKEPGEPDPEIPFEIKVDRIEIQPNSIAGYVGDRTILDANVYPANATNTSLLWESSNTAVASVSAAGLVTLLGEGEAVITCTAKDGSGVSVTCPVTVSVRQDIPKDIKVEMISIQKNNHEGYPGDELRLDVTVYPENATNPEIQWESSNPSVASVTNAGVVTLLSEGEAVITGRATDGSGVSVSCVVKVKAQPIIEQPKEIKVERITIDRETHEGYPDEEVTLVVTVYPENATNPAVLWESSNSEIASVTEGKITLIKEGSAVIKGSAADGSGVSVTCSVKVKARPSGIDGVKADNKVTVEQSQLTVSGLNNGDIVSLYSISGAIVATERCNGDSVTFTLRNHGIYIIVTPSGSFKVRF